eukprot:10484686-Lingulodinium_polyedra.AAC.1
MEFAKKNWRGAVDDLSDETGGAPPGFALSSSSERQSQDFGRRWSRPKPAARDYACRQRTA